VDDTDEEAPKGMGASPDRDRMWSTVPGESLEALSTPEGVFWADHIKTLYDRPADRLDFARRYLPLPGAFREALTATRALIRKSRKAGEDTRPLLEELYQLAALNFYLNRRDRVDGLPAWNVVGVITAEEIASLRFWYDEIGYEVLDTLKPTDRKWLVEAFGEPGAHRDPREVFVEPFQSGLRRFREQQQAEEARFQAEFNEGIRRNPSQHSRSGCAGILLVLAGLGALGVFGLA